MFAEYEIFEKIKSIAKKCGIDDSEIPIKQSSIADDPIY